MRCPDCNKFVGLELNEEPEAELEIDEEGNVTGSVRLVRQCADCGTELKEASFDVDVSPAEVVAHAQKHKDDRADKDKAHADDVAAAKAAGEPEPEIDDNEEEFELEVDVESSEATEEGGGRWKKSFFGVNVTFLMKCSCGEFEHTDTFEDKIAASHMDELT